MTERWKSNPMFWCDYCKVWLQDNPSAKATHERGMKHMDAVAKKLRQMRHKADSDKKEEALASRTMASIEEQARQQYEKDLAAAQASASSIGDWVLDEGSGYLYNAAQRYYHSRDTGMYYGGDPPAWTTQPEMPPEALYKAPKAESKSGQGDAAKAGPRRAAAAGAKTVAIPAHPLAQLGGYRMPEGQIGGARGVGSLGATSQPAVKRKREEGPAAGKAGTAASEDELKARAAREAAKARVEQRTAKQFGMV